MNNYKPIVIRAALILIILLIFLSIYGAFLGSERARDFFNSPILSAFWLALTLSLIAGLAVFHRLARVPGLLLMHLGCIFILVGSVWGSKVGHKIQKQLFGIDKITSGTMMIYEGLSQSIVRLENSSQVKELPFSIHLKDFRLEHYKPEYLYVQASSGQNWKFPVEIDKQFNLGDDFGTITILKTFENCKIIIDGFYHTAIDSREPGYNPALQIRLTAPDGTVKEKYIFERFPGHSHPEEKFKFRYFRIVSDYISAVKVVKDDNTLAEKNVEVNHPLHFGGYHFYQHSYDNEAGKYTVLMVCSDSGLYIVYIGYLLLGCGAFWHFWFRNLLKK